ncbi:MAG: ABC transporter permease subunit [Chloroflexi bacterium]|nr:ABC transporter permease subunit [Chloroflexota bacterium]
MKTRTSPVTRFISWAILALCVAYLTVPLITQFDYSLRMRRNTLSFDAYSKVLAIPEGSVELRQTTRGVTLKMPRFYSSLAFSVLAGVLTIAFSTLVIVPTTYWVHLRLPRLKPVLEFISVLPFAIPGIVLTLGLLRTYSAPPFALTNTEAGTMLMLVGGYTVFVLPYTFRSIDAGLRAIDIRTLTDAARSLGANWATVIWRVILPNLRVAVISASLITFAVAIGEYALVNFLFPDERSFGSYLAAMGRNKIYEPAALTIISYLLTWGLVLLIQRIARGTSQPSASIR